ncbi:uncharacterized protein LOC142320000 [Lycorma delicatula]|uniref:uncharacterized protein LOC142320000 n=1 Tax=Lycorma delicatula TaxID=130591 RepID=UPI003F50F3EA
MGSGGSVPNKIMYKELEPITDMHKRRLGFFRRNLEDAVFKTSETADAESEILLNDVSPLVYLNMKSNELRIKDFHTVKTKDGMVFYPCRVMIDKLTITASTKNCKRCVNNSVYDGIIKQKSSECNCANGDVRTENLVKDISSENEEKNYVCNFCHKVFNYSSNLKQHLNIHTKEKNYICNFCQKSFNRKSNLRMHLNIHTKEENYICYY